MTTLEIIRQLCDEKGISLAALERELHFANGSLAKSKSLSSERVYELARYFGKPMEYLMTGERERINKDLEKLEERRRVLEEINGLNEKIMDAYRQISKWQIQLDDLNRKYDAMEVADSIKLPSQYDDDEE